MVERAGGLLDPLRLGAHLDDEDFGGHPQFRRGGDAEAAADQALDVDGRAGEGHRGVQREGQGPGAAGGVEYGGAVAAGGVHEELAGAYGAGAGEARDQVGERVVGDGEQDEVGAGQYGGGFHQRDAGEQRFGSAAGGVGHAGGGDGAVAA